MKRSERQILVTTDVELHFDLQEAYRKYVIKQLTDGGESISKNKFVCMVLRQYIDASK